MRMFAYLWATWFLDGDGVSRSSKAALGVLSIVLSCVFSFHLDSPGRIHHCMRSIGVASKALDLMIDRVTDPSRKTFGKYLYQHGMLIDLISFNSLLGPLHRYCRRRYCQVARGSRQCSSPCPECCASGIHS